MAKVVITLTDNPQDRGGISIVAEFDPPLAEGVEYTPAQVLTAELLDYVTGADESKPDPARAN